MSHKFIRPFGPTIYHGVLNKDEVWYLQQVAQDTKEGQNVGYDLAGNIKDQKGIVVKDMDKFTNTIQPHIRKYMKFESDRFDSHLLDPGEEKSFDNVNFNLGTGPWINFQIKDEFNPMHSHSGMISAVVYIDVPEVIANEEYTKDTNMNCPGQIEFLYGPDVVGANGTHKIIPKTGDFLLFHAGLKHTVYPFKSDVTRTSMSFNVMGME
jgi:uncharacterized protein (TIGR02466 family)|tara:strand:+ start:784 stop:1410 length:627 start_codon:yes stop_codon:yes gene_type:complete